MVTSRGRTRALLDKVAFLPRRIKCELNSTIMRQNATVDFKVEFNFVASNFKVAPNI